jgi:NADH-quinone oxidoreductase subunit M
MILLWLILILIGAGLLAAIAARWSGLAARWITLCACAVNFVLVLTLWAQKSSADLNWDWIPQFGIRFHLALDGLSLTLLILTFFLGMIATLASWKEIQRSVGFFHFNLLWVLAGITGVFLSVDLFLFYLFWELMLVPMYFLIAIWGYENRIYAAIKFFLFTQLSGLAMLVAILTLAGLHQQSTGFYSFDYTQLLTLSLTPTASRWLMLGFFVAFAVKMPAFPLHTWLPDAHTEAPTAGSVILAGLLLKTGAYGIIRFVVPLFPDAVREFAPWIMAVGVIGILYGAVLAFAQTDLKRLVAYTSVSHMGFVLVGIFAGNALALQGAVVLMVCHGISTGALFILAGALKERTHTRELEAMGGLWDTIPALSGAGLFFVMASIGIPGLGDFVGEFLVLLGTYPVSIPLASFAAVGMVAGAIYGLRLSQKVFFGPNKHNWKLPDTAAYEWMILVPMIACLFWIGLYPRPLLDTIRPALTSVERR